MDPFDELAFDDEFDPDYEPELRGLFSRSGSDEGDLDPDPLGPGEPSGPEDPSGLGDPLASDDPFGRGDTFGADDDPFAPDDPGGML